MQKAMIPVGAIDGVPHYLCVTCARQLLMTTPSSGDAVSTPTPA
jgi:hypothetical protein